MAAAYQFLVAKQQLYASLAPDERALQIASPDCLGCDLCKVQSLPELTAALSLLS